MKRCEVGIGHCGSRVETGAAGARAHDTTSAVTVTPAIGRPRGWKDQEKRHPLKHRQPTK
ncbi:unnamed protein product [Gulo gulo]|uniref:Uncharacterized protein n=1 Tax=Gulo gulo TaxID=48420 RepID=A0A9X9LYI5_GULGU|nr:unnamed protein product [Gulo gulo]